jgi:hypothetical protein
MNVLHSAKKMPPRVAVQEQVSPQRSQAEPSAIGEKKTLSQHIGNAGFGASTVAAFTDSLSTMMDTVMNFPGLDAVPGLNLGVAFVEGYNSIKKLVKDKEPIPAATSGGNALGSMGSFLAQLSLAPILLKGGIRSGLFLGVGAALGAAGGVLGLAAGVAEVRHGREQQKAGLGSRTFAMGVLDIASGVCTLAGAGAMAVGAAPVALALMMAGNLVDLAGIGVDYLWKRHTANAKAEAAEKNVLKQEPAERAAVEQSPAERVDGGQDAGLSVAAVPAVETVSAAGQVVVTSARGCRGSAPTALVQL